MGGGRKKGLRDQGTEGLWGSETTRLAVSRRNAATVTLKSYPDHEFRGVVESIGVSTDFELPESEVPQPRQQRMRGTPVVAVRIRLDETDATLLPGLSAAVSIRRGDG